VLDSSCVSQFSSGYLHWGAWELEAVSSTFPMSAVSDSLTLTHQKSRMLRFLLPRCDASTRLMLSSVGASGAVHAVVAVVIVAVFGALSPNLLQPPHGRNSIQLAASSLIIVDAAEAKPAEAPEFTLVNGTNFLKPDGAGQPDARQTHPVDPLSPSPAVAMSGRVGESIRRAETSSDLPSLSAANVSVSKRQLSRIPPSAVSLPPSTARAGQLDEIPATIHSPRPEYPAEALRVGIEGRVVLRVELDRRGDVTQVTVITSSRHGSLDEAARQAVRQWRFEPATRLSVPVATAIAVPISFRIERD